MRALTLLFASAAVFGASSWLPPLPAAVTAVVAVALGLVLAVAASASFHPLAFAGGALGALAAGTFAALARPSVDPVCLAVAAGALLAGPAFLERTTRVPRRAAALVHLTLALGGGALAGGVAAGFVGHDACLRAVAISVAALAMLAPLLVNADDHVAHGLRIAAERVPEPAAGLLRRAVLARVRKMRDEHGARFSAGERRAWRRLLDLAIARVEAARGEDRSTVYRGESPREEASVALDAGIAKAVESLERGSSVQSSRPTASCAAVRTLP